MERVCVYRGFQDALFCAAGRQAVLDCFGNEDTFSTMFGGCARYGGVFSKPRLLGVWGARNAARFRRLLRERHGEIEIVHAKPPARHAGNTVTALRLSATQRESLERKVKRNWPPSDDLHNRMTTRNFRLE